MLGVDLGTSSRRQPSSAVHFEFRERPTLQLLEAGLVEGPFLRRSGRILACGRPLRGRGALACGVDDLGVGQLSGGLLGPLQDPLDALIGGLDLVSLEDPGDVGLA